MAAFGGKADMIVVELAASGCASANWPAALFIGKLRFILELFE